MAAGNVRVDIVVEGLKAFAIALQAAAKVFTELGQTMQRSFYRNVQFLRLNVIMSNGADNETAAGEWQSDACATWLHGSCRGGTFCVCGCHR